MRNTLDTSLLYISAGYNKYKLRLSSIEMAISSFNYKNHTQCYSTSSEYFKDKHCLMMTMINTSFENTVQTVFFKNLIFLLKINFFLCIFNRFYVLILKIIFLK